MKALDLADYIIEESNKHYNPVTNLKLQKLMYFINVMYLLKNRKSLITDYKFEKWDYGPVVPKVYFEYSKYGASEIKHPSTRFNIQRDKNGSYSVSSSEFNSDDLEESDKRFIDEGLEKLINFDAFDLVNKSHKENQWLDKSNKEYNDGDTIKYYSDVSNNFWNK